MYVKNLFLLIIFVIVGFVIYDQIQDSNEAKLAKESLLKESGLLPDHEAKSIKRERENRLRVVTQKKDAISKKIKELNSEAGKCYIKARNLLQFTEDTYKEIKAIRLESDVASRGTLGMKRAKALIKKCEDGALMYRKAGNAFTFLAKMLYKAYTSKTYELNDTEKLKFDRVVGKLKSFLENTKEIETVSRDVGKIIAAAFSQLTRKKNAKAYRLRLRERGKAYASKYGHSFYRGYKYVYDGYKYSY